MFGVEEILLYPDHIQENQMRELEFCEQIFGFIETPQYLRKRLYRLNPQLRFVGILPPLQTPHHSVASSIRDCKVGDLREGIVMGRRGDALLVDAGLEHSVECHGDLPVGIRVTIVLKNLERNLVGEVVDKSKISIYWGYKVRRSKFSLGSLLEREEFDLKIGTSRYGARIVDLWSEIGCSLRSMKSALVAFGSPRMGLREILGQENRKAEEAFDFFVNTIPDQKVSTVRTEEAILISLGLLNLMRLR